MKIQSIAALVILTFGISLSAQETPPPANPPVGTQPPAEAQAPPETPGNTQTIAEPSAETQAPAQTRVPAAADSLTETQASAETPESTPAETPPPVPTAAPAATNEAAPAPTAATYSSIVFGVHTGLGIGMVFNTDANWVPRLTGMGEFHFMYFFNRMVGIDLGAGVMSKGAKSKENGAEYWFKEIRMEIPIGIAFNFANFRLGISVVPSVSLKAKSISEIEGEKVDYNWSNEDWEAAELRRFNICARTTLGGRIPLNTHIALLLSAIVESEILNNYIGDDSSYNDRSFNLMFTIGAEFGL